VDIDGKEVYRQFVTLLGEYPGNVCGAGTVDDVYHVFIEVPNHTGNNLDLRMRSTLD
jgi:hypothetical protein